MRPAGPLPETWRRSIPASLARSRTAGDASGFSPSGLGAPRARAGGGAAGGGRDGGRRPRFDLGLPLAGRRRLRLRLGAPGRLLAVRPEPDQGRPHGDGFPDFGAEPENLAGNGRGYFDRRLVGHHGAENIVLAHEVADLDLPLHQFGLGDAFADIGHLDHALAHSHASNVASSARPTRAGPGK